MFYTKYLKRPLDILFAVLGLIVLSPLFVFLAIWIKLDSVGPVFFQQKRAGKGKTIFPIYKFRTMKTDTPHDIPTHMLQDTTAFITRSGRLLRKTSLDELPQLINILKGDMSIIGPRPALWNQDDLIRERDKYNANDIRPGLTGLAQINGRDELDITEKARLDGEYVKRMCFTFDAKCFFSSIQPVLKQENIKNDS